MASAANLSKQAQVASSKSSASSAAATNASNSGVVNAQKTAGVNIDLDKAVARNKALGYSRDLWKAIQQKVGLSGKDVDGYVGPTTTRAIAQKQPALGFTGKDVDGICGPKTLAALGLSKNSKPSSSGGSTSTPAPKTPAAPKVDVNAAKAWYAKKNYTRDCIKNIQRAVGFTNSKDIDGYIGPNTINKVAEWQAAHGLTPDGEFGSKSASVAGITLVSNKTSSGGSSGGSGGGGSVADKEIELFGRRLNRYSDTRNWCYSFTQPLNVKIRDNSGSEVSTKITVHKKLADRFTAIFNDIYAECPNFKFQKTSGGYYIGSTNYRNVGGTNKLSYHSYGVAVDINEQYNPMLSKSSKGDGHSDGDIRIRSTSHPVVKIFARHGFGWGGTYNDYMHFSYFNGW